MPVHPTEENTESGIFDQVAKESKDSTASDHPIHQEGKEPPKAAAEDHKSKGPAIPESVPSAEGTKEELQEKAKKLNE